MPARLAALFLLLAATLSAQTLPPQARLLMSHFAATVPGGDERLYISWSADGVNWTALNNGQPVWQPPGWAPFDNVVRDPSITFANGFYWVVYTSGNYGRGLSFGLLKSADLLNWTHVTQVSTAIPATTNPFTWSPVFFEDGDGSIHVTVSICRVDSGFFNPVPHMRIYELHPVNADWTQWSAPAPVELPDACVNDAWFWKEGDTYHCVYTDFQSASANIHATSSNLLTGWTNRQPLGFTGQEGNIVLPHPGGGYRYYLEVGNTTGNAGYRYCDYAVDFTSPPTPWTYVNATVPMRNGKVCAARGAQSFAQWQTLALPGVPPEKRGPLDDADADGLANLVEHTLATDPLAHTTRRPALFFRTPANAGLRFDFLRASTDVTATAQIRRGPAAWSESSADVLTESRTLLSDGTTRIHARAVAPLASEPMVLRVAAQQSNAAPASKSPSSAAPSRLRSSRRPAFPSAPSPSPSSRRSLP